ncbi:ABC transporter ATP-binding protein [Alicyclobacillus fastidiosus]|uniref:ABC transporter ATP-binding protein n=1 Tax=Alicyclobacillus fastidiosus TaxID=392011 RepID=A0ABV5ABN8_9BACL|nr:ABC transporter ATP-binding protein [Alicyclobacillus fastidiosus]WEH07611.1 ABC transporter ATP-binding protein [Alicyclobacillus fastidiosus]
MLRLLPYVVRHWTVYLPLLCLMVVEAFTGIFFAWFLKNSTEAAIHHETATLEWTLAAGMGFIVLTAAVSYLTTYLGAKAISLVKRDLKTDLFNHILRLPTEHYTKYHSGDLVSRLTHDVGNISGAVGESLLNLIRLVLISGFSLIYIFTMNRVLAVSCLLFGPVAVAIGSAFSKAMRKNNSSLYHYLGQVNSFLNEAFAGHLVVRAFTLESVFAKRFLDDSHRVSSLEVKSAQYMGTLRAGSSAVGAAALLFSVGLGTIYVSKGYITVGALMAFVSLVQQVVQPIRGVSGQLGNFQRSLAASERLWKIFAEPVELDRLHEYRGSMDVREGLVTRGLTFSYDGVAKALLNVTMRAPVGQKIAIVGQSGAGKSTLFKLLLGLYKPSSGQIWIDGKAVDQMAVDELRSYIAYVPQETILFGGTVRENLLLGRPDASEVEMIAAATDANAHDFILALPKGYDTDIGELGVRLSGGQRQRLAIARAMLRNAPILLLDEATSAMDAETELFVKEALERLVHKRTTLVIAHRLSTVRDADMIVVLKQGQVVEQGKHDDLLARGGEYSRLYRLQFQNRGTARKSIDDAV